MWFFGFYVGRGGFGIYWGVVEIGVGVRKVSVRLGVYIL